MARRGKKKKSLVRRIRRLVFLASATAAIVRFAMARRPKTQPSGRRPSGHRSTSRRQRQPSDASTIE